MVFKTLEKIKIKQYFIFLKHLHIFLNNFNTVNIVRLNVHEGFGYVTDSVSILLRYIFHSMAHFGLAQTFPIRV